jgi:hypothetical protein
MVTAVEALTAVVVITKLADCVAPSGTVTIAGGDATAGSELVRVTKAPPTGAGCVILTEFCVVGCPPPTCFGLMVSDEREVGFTVKTLDTVTPP